MTDGESEHWGDGEASTGGLVGPAGVPGGGSAGTNHEESIIEQGLFRFSNAPDDRPGRSQLLAQYELYVNGRETVIVRRQTVHNFMVSANALLVGALALAWKDVLAEQRSGGIAILVGVAGVFVNYAWLRLARDYAELSRAKIMAIRVLEKHLPAALFRTERETLCRGNYEGLAKLEVFLPRVFLGLHLVVIAGGIVRLLLGS
jgi:hypothetical protein